MDILLSQSETESFPIKHKENIHNSHSGILTSEYKSAGVNNLNSSKQNTVYSSKQLAKSRMYQVNSGVEFVLRVAVFLTIFAFIF